MSIEAFTPVDLVMRECPATIRVFLDHGFHCVGCPIGSFHTVEDACREHAAELGSFLAALRAVAGETTRHPVGPDEAVAPDAAAGPDAAVGPDEAVAPDTAVTPGRPRLRRAASGGAGRGG